MKISKPVLAMAILLALAAFFLLCLQGYSFSAICCTAAAGIIGFYTFVPRIFKKSRTVIRLFTILLVLALIVLGVTEGIIIHAARGNPEEPAEYLLVLGAKVNKRGPSLALIEEETGVRPEKLGVLSSEFHLFRARMFAREAGVTPIAIPARTSDVATFVSYFLREIGMVWYYTLIA